jgi:hypothetical protein
MPCSYVAMLLGKPRVDEEALAEALPAAQRRSRGAFFTPAPLVEAVLDAVAPHLPASGPLTVVDPAAGAGAFLHRAGERLPRAARFGLEVDADCARACQGRLPGARILTGDGLREGWDRLCVELPPEGFELWVGNPPYNGTSAVLKDKAAYRALCGLLGDALPPGTSLREDYAFFLLRVAERLSHRPGALAFVTSATLLDAYLYAPLRAALLERLQLREVFELGDGVFRGTRVRTCVTVWTRGRTRGAVAFRSRSQKGPFDPSQLSSPRAFTPSGSDWLLRPAPDAAAALDAQWRAQGELLTTLLPVHSPGLKTRFDELLVDDAPEPLLARLDAFLSCPPRLLEGFAAAHRIPERHLPKLLALKASDDLPARAEPERVRAFWRYAGPRHRGVIPQSARAFCYLDRRLIPRGDHRFRGPWDPHAHPVKLVFNTRELPLSAALLESPGCVHDHRHARFAPLFVPRLLRDHGLAAARSGADLGDEVPNLSMRGLAWARGHGGPLALFRALAAFINSDPVQQVWAPAFGASRDLPVPVARLPPAH